MNPANIAERLAVCSWSLQPENLADLITKLQATGINRLQLALDPLRERPPQWRNTESELRAAGITLASGMFGCVGENYSTMETIRLTGGLVPDATWEQNLENIKATTVLAANLGLKLVTFHAGFVPHDPVDAGYKKILARLATVADLFAAKKIAVGLETGQETAADLAALLRALSHPNLGVNFDPANMLLYGKGNPIQAVRQLGKWIRQVHIKDANRTSVPGTWGSEVVAGKGEVNWREFFQALNEVGFTGDLVIEREAGSQRVPDICAAREVVLQSAR
jgi:L-ribulose-5-phosphate 3-epimerase